MNDKVQEFIQKTLANDSSAEQAFKEFIKQKTLALLYPPAPTPPAEPAPTQTAE